MGKQNFQLGTYLSENIEQLVKDIIRKTPENPKESAFLARFALASRNAARKREKALQNGEQIPAFLIASITSSCNLHCAGCYARQNHACTDHAPVDQLTAAEWAHIFSQAKELGISFILLAGGEPLLRKDVLEAAGAYPEIAFPIFTNGTLLDEALMQRLDKNRNLLPMLSMEGNRQETDQRRGDGIYAKLQCTMDLLRQKSLIFGASITVTTENLSAVTDAAFLNTLQSKGCKAVVYVEYVPVTEESRSLALGETERQALQKRLDALRSNDANMIFISFPGDEAEMGGCLAAGRGFFHINSHGGAEPCPFSPYSDINVKDTSLRAALQSPLFTALRDQEILSADHRGGCVLFEERVAVEQLLAAMQSN